MYIRLLSLLIVYNVTFLWVYSSAFADSLPNNGPIGKSYRGSSGLDAASPDFNFGFDSGINSILEDSRGLDHYDQITLNNLKRLKEETQPVVRPLDPDLDRANRAAQRALTIQSARSLGDLVNGSELKPFFMDVKRGLDQIKESVRYSVQTDGQTLSLSKQSGNKKLLEFNIDFNFRQGIDPLLTMGEHTRMRYDFIEKAPLIEFIANF